MVVHNLPGEFRCHSAGSTTSLEFVATAAEQVRCHRQPPTLGAVRRRGVVEYPRGINFQQVSLGTSLVVFFRALKTLDPTQVPGKISDHRVATALLQGTVLAKRQGAFNAQSPDVAGIHQAIFIRYARDPRELPAVRGRRRHWPRRPNAHPVSAPVCGTTGESTP
jgi:hypothetical protein